MAEYLQEPIITNTAVLIPCLNEAQTIVHTCREIKKAIPNALVCVGDNNSTDNTAELAGAEPSVDVLISCPMPGKGAATRKMVHMVKADWYVTLDGDMTYEPAAAAAMLTLAKATGAIVSGERTLARANQPLFHKSGNRLVDKLVSLKCHKRARDVMTGCRAIPGRLLQDFVDRSLYNGFEIETAFTIYALDHGVEILYVSCPYYKRPAGSKSKLRTFQDGAKIIKTILES